MNHEDHQRGQPYQGDHGAEIAFLQARSPARRERPHLKVGAGRKIVLPNGGFTPEIMGFADFRAGRGPSRARM